MELNADQVAALNSFQDEYGDKWQLTLQAFHLGYEWDNEHGPMMRQIRNNVTADVLSLPDLRERS